MKKLLGVGALSLGLLLTSCGASSFNGGLAMVKVEMNGDLISNVTLDESTLFLEEVKLPENFDAELKDLLVSFNGLTKDEVFAISTKKADLPYIATVDTIEGCDAANVQIINAVKFALGYGKDKK